MCKQVNQTFIQCVFSLKNVSSINSEKTEIFFFFCISTICELAMTETFSNMDKCFYFIIIGYSFIVMSLHRPHHSIDTFDAALQEVENIPAYLPNCLQLKDVVTKAKKWLHEAEMLQVK